MQSKHIYESLSAKRYTLGRPEVINIFQICWRGLWKKWNIFHLILLMLIVKFNIHLVRKQKPNTCLLNLHNSFQVSICTFDWCIASYIRLQITLLIHNWLSYWILVDFPSILLPLKCVIRSDWGYLLIVISLNLFDRQMTWLKRVYVV